MPYQRQRAAKTGHSSFFAEELEKFLGNCHYLKTLDSNEQSLVATFKTSVKPSKMSKNWMWASDGSRYIASVKDGAPTTRVGYIKVSHVGFSWEDFVEISSSSSRFVNPLAVANLRSAVKTIVWMLPGSNIRYKSATTARDGFRLRMHELLESTKISDDAFSLYETLFKIKDYATHGMKKELNFHLRECPECGHLHSGSGLMFNIDCLALPCENCGNYIYASDILGFHREYDEHGINDGVFTRIMSFLEIMMLARRLDGDENKYSFIADSIFFYDGLLAVYGESSWICKGMLELYLDVKKKIILKGQKPPIIVGIAKSGQLMRHAEAILGCLSPNDIVPLSLEYRRTILKHSIDNKQRPFFQSRWGQDFIWKTEKCQPIVLSLPFWTSDFHSHQDNIHLIENYPELSELLGALNSIDCSLFPSAFIPIVFAHEEASIAWEPGGRLLKEATYRALRQQ